MYYVHNLRIFILVNSLTHTMFSMCDSLPVVRCSRKPDKGPASWGRRLCERVLSVAGSQRLGMMPRPPRAAVPARRLQDQDGSWDPDSPGLAFALQAHMTRPGKEDWVVAHGNAGALAMATMLAGGGDEEEVVAEADRKAWKTVVDREDCPLIGGQWAVSLRPP